MSLPLPPSSSSPASSSAPAAPSDAAAPPPAPPRNAADVAADLAASLDAAAAAAAAARSQSLAEALAVLPPAEGRELLAREFAAARARRQRDGAPPDRARSQAFADVRALLAAAAALRGGRPATVYTVGELRELDPSPDMPRDDLRELQLRQYLRYSAAAAAKATAEEARRKAGAGAEGGVAGAVAGAGADAEVEADFAPPEGEEPWPAGLGW